MSTSTSTPVVRVQLQLQLRDGRPADRPKELARMCTSKGVEVVQDVEGLMMIRLAKRKCQEQPNIVHGERNEAAAEAPPASAPSEAAAQEAQPPASPAPEHLASPQQQNDDGQPPEAQHGSEDQAGDQGAADAEQQAERGWLLASHLSPPPQPPPLDLEAEVEKLKRFLPEQLPAASQVQWLLSQALALAVNNTNDESAASVASSFMASFQDCLSKRVSAARQLLQQGGPAELEAFDRLPPFIRKQCASDRLAAALRQQLDKLQQEEKAWAALQDKYSRVAGAGEASSAPGSATGQGGGEVQEQQQQQQQAVVDLQPMVAVQERADMQLGFQVEAIHTMLERAEQLVEQAQQACTLLQGDYHKENFQSYAHINSPQVLIKILSQAQGPTQPHASQQAVAGEDCVPATQACEG